MTLFIPASPDTFSQAQVANYLANIVPELSSISFDEAERQQLTSAMFDKYLDESRQSFFLYHFSPLIHKAAQVFFQKKRSPHILELGCGSGTMSILLASLGANVTAIDLDPVSISVCRKRQQRYEQDFGALPLRFLSGNALMMDSAGLGQFDGVYSLFAFNMMQPTRVLLDKFVPSIAPAGRFMISDGNKDQLYNRFFRKRRCLSPFEMCSALEERGFSVKSLTFDCAIPPAFVGSPALFSIMHSLESRIASTRWMRLVGTSYTLVAEKLA